MLKSESVTIDEVEYTTTQFPAMTSFELLAKLVKQVGPALAIVASADAGDSLNSIAPALMSALSGLDPVVARGLVVEVLASTSALVREANGSLRLVALNTPANIDIVFSGKLKQMFLVLGHALRVNYGDFSGGSDPAAPEAPTPNAQ